MFASLRLRTAGIGGGVLHNMTSIAEDCRLGLAGRLAQERVHLWSTVGRRVGESPRHALA